MTSTFTPNYNLELQGTGDNAGTWGQELNNNVFSTLDSSLGNALILTVSGGTLTLTSTQMNNVFFGFQGTLTSDQTIIFPQIFRPVIIRNTTTGSFNLNVRTSSPTSAILTIQPRSHGAFFFLSPSGFNLMPDVFTTSLSVPGNLPMYSDSSGCGLTDSGIAPPVIASQAVAEAGTSNDFYNSPLRTTQQTTARVASQAAAQGGTDNFALMTPLRTSQAIQAQSTPYPSTTGDVNNLNYPVGTTLIVNGIINRNQPTSVYLSSDSTQFQISPTASQLAGSWLARGATGAGTMMVQRAS